MHICGWVLPVMNEGSRIETGHHHFPGCKKKTTSQYIALSFANETWHQIFLDVSLKCVGHLIFHREISSKFPASSAQFSCPLEVTWAQRSAVVIWWYGAAFIGWQHGTGWKSTMFAVGIMMSMSWCFSGHGCHRKPFVVCTRVSAQRENTSNPRERLEGHSLKI